MNQDLILAGALANTNGAGKTKDLLSYLSDEVEGLDLYYLQPSPGMKAAIDWQAILATSASLVAVARGLWAAYEKFIKPLRDRDPKSTAGLFIQVREKDGRSTQFFVGPEYKDKDVFIQTFTERVETLRVVQDDKGNQRGLRDEIERSGTWVRIK